MSICSIRNSVEDTDMNKISPYVKKKNITLKSFSRTKILLPIAKTTNCRYEDDHNGKVYVCTDTTMTK